MLKYLSIILIFLSSCSSHREPVSQDILSLSGFTMIEAPHGFDTILDSGARGTVRSYYTTGSTIINGSYFGMAPWPDGKWRGTGMNIPAGLWIASGEMPYPIRTDDPNLSHAVFLSGNVLSILPNNQASSWIARCLAITHCRGFQAGPLVLSGNIIQDFGVSWHAREPHERTLIGVTASGRVYFFISTTALSLQEVGERILEEKVFQTDPITVLNLDGGPSTAYYDGLIGFRADINLPILFRIRK